MPKYECSSGIWKGIVEARDWKEAKKEFLARIPYIPGRKVYCKRIRDY